MRKKHLALLLAAVMAATSIDSTALMVSGADFSAEAAEETEVQDAGSGLEVETDADESEDSEAAGSGEISEQVDFADEIEAELEPETDSEDEISVTEESEEGETEDLFADEEGTEVQAEEEFSDEAGASDTVEVPSNVTELVPDNGGYTATIAAAGEEVWYSFTPSETGEYIFRAESDGSNQAYIYEQTDEGLSPIGYDKNSGSTGASIFNFRLINTLTEGKTYYYRTSLRDTNRTGSYTVYLTKHFADVQVVSAALNMDNARKRFVANVDDCFIEGAELTVNYKGSEVKSETVIFDGVRTSICDKYGNRFYYEFYEQGSSTSTCRAGGHLKEGTSSVKVMLNTHNDDNTWFGTELTSVEVEAGDPENIMTAGNTYTTESVSHLSGLKRTWWMFTPSKTAKYEFTMPYSVMVCKKGETQDLTPVSTKKLDSKQQMYTYELEENTSYYISFYHSGSQDSRERFQTDVTVKKVAEVESITVNGAAGNENMDVAAGLPCYMGANLTFNYDDKTSKPFTFPLGSTGCTYEGKPLKPVIMDESNQKYPIGSVFKYNAGKRYYLKFTYGDIVSEGHMLNVQELEKTALYRDTVLTAGRNEMLQSPDNGYRYYKFVPTADGRFNASVTANGAAAWKLKEDGTYEALTGSTWLLKKDDIVYFQLWGGAKGSTQGNATVSLKEQLYITGLEYTESNISMISALEAIKGAELPGGLKLKYGETVSGIPWTVRLGDTSRIYDNYGNIVTVKFFYKDENNSWAEYEWPKSEDNLAAGEYKYVFTTTDSNGSEIELEVPVKVTSLEDSYQTLQKLKTGENNVTLTFEGTWYRYEPETDGNYSIYTKNNPTRGGIVHLTENGKLENVDGNQTYPLKAGEKYLIRFGSMGQTLEDILEIVKVPTVKSIELISSEEKELTFLEDIDAVRFDGLKVKVTMENGEEEILKIYDNYAQDKYRRTLGLRLYEVPVDENSIPVTGMNLPAGEYEARITYEYSNEPRLIIPVHVISIKDATEDTLEKEDKKQTFTAENNRVMFSFTPDSTGTYEFAFNRAIYVMLYDSEGEYQVGTGTKDTTHYASLEKGETYYIFAIEEKDIAELQVTASKVLVPVSMVTTADRTDAVAGVDAIKDMGLKTTVTFDDGTSRVLEERDQIGDWIFAYNITNEQGGGAYYENSLKAGTWTCTPYFRGAEAPQIANAGSVKINARVPDLSSMKEITVDTPVEVEPAEGYQFFRFTPEEAGSYEVKSSIDVLSCICEINANGLGYGTRTKDLAKSTDYVIRVSTPYPVKLTVSKEKTTEQVKIPDQPLKDGYHESFDVTNAKRGIYFTFTPEEDGYYRFWTEGKSYNYVRLYRVGDNGPLDEDDPTGVYGCSLTAKLKGGVAYRYELGWYSGLDAELNFTVNYNKMTEHKDIENLNLVLKDGMKTSDLNVLNDLSDVYDLKISYKDGSSLITEIPDYDYEGTDLYGNHWVVELDNDYRNLEAEELIYTAELRIYDLNTEKFDVRNTVKIPMAGICGLESLKNEKEVYPFRNNNKTESWYIFTAHEDGEYIWQARTEEGEAVPEYDIYTYSLQNGQSIDKNYVHGSWLEGNRFSTVLEKNKTYLVEIDRENIRCNIDIPFKVEKAKTVKSVELKQMPSQTTVYNEGKNTTVSLEGMILTEYYTDGSQEDVIYGKPDSAGREMEFMNAYWTNKGTYKVSVCLGDFVVNIDLNAAEIPGQLAELEAGMTMKLEASDQMIYPVKFTAEKTGYYSIVTENGSVNSVINEKTGKQLIGRDTGNWKRDMSIQYFEKGETYLIYIYTGKKEVAVTVWKDACQWVKDEDSYVPGNCAEPESWTEECKVHDHKRTVSERPEWGGHAYDSWTVTKEPTCEATGEKYRTCIKCSYVEKQTIPATGHKFSDWKVTKQPTCGVAGTEERTCSVCKTVEKRAIAATGKHKYGSWKTTKEATVLTAGQQERSCSVCGKKETSATAKLKATIEMNVSGTVPLKRKQTFNVKVTTGKGDKVVSWKSSNKKVVSVSKNGKIKGIKAGKTATITVQLQSGLKASFKVKVQKKAVATKSIKVTNASTGKNVGKKLTMKAKGTLKLAAAVSPVTSKQKVTYSSSNKKIATVTSKGVIKAKKKGKVTITVKSGKKSYKIKITVK